MKQQLLFFILYVTTIYLTGGVLNPAIAATQPSHGTWRCGVTSEYLNKRKLDQYRNRHARSLATNLNVGEPRSVRMIYFLPNDRPYRADVVQQMKDDILPVQAFFAREMETSGYGRLTFRLETDAQGEPIVHRFNGRHRDSHYLDETVDKVRVEIEEKFDLNANIYLVVIDNKTGIDIAAGIGIRLTKHGGCAFASSNEFPPWLVAHELGHVFGLWHDFRDGSYIMSYGGPEGTELPLGEQQLSPCSAGFLSVHTYFNPNTPIEEGLPPTIELISPTTYPAASHSVPIQFKISDPDGFHQVFLHAMQPDRDTVKACHGYLGQTETTVDYNYNGVIPFAHEPDYSISTNLLDPLEHPIRIEAVDMNGNVAQLEFTLQSEAFADVAEEAVEIPDTNLRSVIETALGKASGDTITAAEMATLTALEVPSANISDLTGLQHAINLTELYLLGNDISNVSPLAGLTNLTTLLLEGTAITDISALTNLTNLTYLGLPFNSISDISPLVANTGLGSGDEVDVLGNPLSALSIKTHIPALQSRGVEVYYDSIQPTNDQPADVNGDGMVDIRDLVLVAVSYGQTGQNDADVNGDGIVNVQDFIVVAAIFEDAAAAPPGQPHDGAGITPADVEGWLILAQGIDKADPRLQRGILFLEQLLTSLLPKETALLSNYPNPFNPETWIPYALAQDADVTLTIYDTNGEQIRRFGLGHQRAGHYTDRNRAVYFDGRNDAGETVSSGVYFYHLSASDYSQTRKMLILK